MPGRNTTYHEQKETKYTLLLRQLLTELPPYARDYFRAVEQKTSAKTRVSYAYDLQVFFRFLLEKNPALSDKKMKEITLNDIDHLASNDIEEYQEYLKYYEADNGEQRNGATSIARKMSSLRSFLDYFYKKEMLAKNVAMQVDMPKLHEKEIIRLDPAEVAILLDQVEDGTGLTKAQKRFHQATKIRDVAILTLLLGTGIRVSECVGLDMDDVDFRNNGIRIRRKGGYEAVVYFGDEVEEALQAYMEERHHTIPKSGHEEALFLSMQNRRISVRAVENLVKKYSSTVTTLKKITPHKLRSTYGTSLYHETGDIYLVADVLGHKDVNTTKKHYAAIDENRRRRAASAVKLREV